MYVLLAFLFFFFFFSFFKNLSTVRGQDDVFSPGKYKFTGSINVKPNGNVNLLLNAKKVGVLPTLQPPSLTAPTQSTHVSTTGTPSEGTFSTSTGPTTGYTTPTEESDRMAGTWLRRKHRQRLS